MNKIKFTVNGEAFTLSGSDVAPDTSLNDFLRNHLNLLGTKSMCHEGGCGACIVCAKIRHGDEIRMYSVNSAPTEVEYAKCEGLILCMDLNSEKHADYDSGCCQEKLWSVVFLYPIQGDLRRYECLVHVLSCHEWEITTVEGVGQDHLAPRRLASHNGTQCGYCSPGWVMALYSLLESKAGVTKQQMEKLFGGNMCRCTGYRPILDALKTFAQDADQSLIQDVEDLHEMKCLKVCDRSNSEDHMCLQKCTDKQQGKPSLLQIDLEAEGSRWYKAYSVQDVFTILTREKTDDYRLVAGNTGKGVYPIDNEPRILIDISSIQSLKQSLLDVNLEVGAGMTLTEVMLTFEDLANKNSDFKYLQELYRHMDLVAHVPVRNIGTVGGNLAMKHAVPEFPSDVFLMLAAVGATVTLVDKTGQKLEMGLDEFLNVSLKERLILDVKLPPLSTQCHVKTYKIMSRAQNAHAVVNAGFCLELNADKTVKMARIVFGNVAARSVRAARTESLLTGRKLYSNETLTMALRSLLEELVPTPLPPDPAPSCRFNVALGLFYKCILSLCDVRDMNPRYVSGGALLEREVSHGTQRYDTDSTLWPLTQPVPKLEALIQCTGTARYACDVDARRGELHVALVLSTVCRADIQGVDASEAMKLKGVFGVFMAKDIPGRNTYTPSVVPWQESDEEILASKHVLYHGQPVALVAAVTHKLAVRAASLVRVAYANVRADTELVLNVRDAIKRPDRMREEITVKATDKGSDVQHVIKGTLDVPSQYHYTMEPQCAAVSLTEHGLLVRSSTQWLDLVHVAVAGAVRLPQNEVRVEVDRVGGAFGAKASCSALVACAAAIVAAKTKRPARLVMPVVDNMRAIGKRQSCAVDYEVGVDSSGVIQYLSVDYYSDCGYNYNDAAGASISDALRALYDNKRYSVRGYSVLTDKPSMTWCRAPGTTEGTAIIEHVMDEISHVTKQDPLEVRLRNLAADQTIMREMIVTIKADANYEQRRKEVETYNAANAWKKRGLRAGAMWYPISFVGNFAVTVSLYHGDGTVSVAHGGIEMGQGINTKVAQVVAYTLGVPLSSVRVCRADSFTSPNSMASNGSITSDSLAYAAIQACKKLLDRLPTKGTWVERVQKAYDDGIDLQSQHMMSKLDAPADYSVGGVCLVETELDVLTGQHVLRRVDVLEDVGRSVSPAVDVGQIEGAFMMGVGLWTTEQLQYASNGRLLTDRTWTYKPPGAKDVPVEFNIAFRAKSENPHGVLRSKATGEPAMTMAVVVTFALREAIMSARTEYGHTDVAPSTIDTPYGIEQILSAISPNIEHMKIK